MLGQCADRAPTLNLAPVLLHDESQVQAYLDSFPVDQYTVHEVRGLGSFYLETNGAPDLIKDALRTGHRWDEAVLREAQGLIGPGDTVLDIGAHVGTIALPVAHLVGPQGAVFAFEPQRKLYRELVKNVELNGLDNVVALRYALGDTTAIIEMDPPSEGNEGGTGVGHGGDTVELRPLDSFGFSTVSLVKIDVEGFENQVLDGAREMLRATGLPPLLIEIMGGRSYVTAHPSDRAKVAVTERRLEAMGYRVLWLEKSDYLAMRTQAYTSGLELDFSREGNTDQYRCGHWATPLGPGRWIFDGCPAGVQVAVDSKTVRTDPQVSLNLLYYRSRTQSWRTVVVYADDIKLGSWMLDTSVPPDKQKQVQPPLVIPAYAVKDGRLKVTVETSQTGPSQAQADTTAQPVPLLGIQRMSITW